MAPHAQEVDDEIVRINSAVVSIEVLVTDKQTGERVDGLKREDFEVTDEGRPQTLTFFSQGMEARDPLALVLLTDLDLQSLSELHLLRLRAALRRAMVGSLRNGDQVAVITLSPEAKIAHVLGHDRQGVLETLTPTAAGAGERPKRLKRDDITSGLLTAVRHVQERRKQFRLELVVVSERPYVELKQAAKSSVDELLASGAVVNAIRKSGGRDDVLGHICDQTGGEVIKLRGNDYSDALERIIENLARRYSIGFTPDETLQDGRFHNLRVSIRPSATLGRHRPFVVRARRGYVAGNSGPLDLNP